MQQASECVVRFLGQGAGEAMKNLMSAAEVNRSISQGQVAGGLEEVLEAASAAMSQQLPFPSHDVVFNPKARCTCEAEQRTFVRSSRFMTQVARGRTRQKIAKLKNVVLLIYH